MNDAPEKFFEKVYGAHYRALHAFLYGKTGDSQVALDLLQETFLRVWLNLHVVQALETKKQGYWIFAVAKNLTTDYFRKCGRQSVLKKELATAQNDEKISAGDVNAIVANKEEFPLVHKAIGQLPQDMRTVFMMSVLGGLSSSEIARRLDKPAGTIRYCLSMARKQLAKNLKVIENKGLRRNHADE